MDDTISMIEPGWKRFEIDHEGNQFPIDCRKNKFVESACCRIVLCLDTRQDWTRNPSIAPTGSEPNEQDCEQTSFKLAVNVSRSSTQFLDSIGVQLRLCCTVQAQQKFFAVAEHSMRGLQTSVDIAWIETEHSGAENSAEIKFLRLTLVCANREVSKSRGLIFGHGIESRG